MSWVEGAIGSLFGFMAVATLVEWFRVMWEMSMRDARAGGFGMGRIRGERPGLLYGKAGLIDGAGDLLGFCMFIAIAGVLWLDTGSSWLTVVASLILGIVTGASGPSGLPPENP